MTERTHLRGSAEDGRTYALPHCDRCPPLASMPTRSLIVGTCPECGRPIDGQVAARVLRARQLVKERTDAV